MLHFGKPQGRCQGRPKREEFKSASFCGWVIGSDYTAHAWCWPKDCQVMMWMCEQAASASWLCLVAAAYHVLWGAETIRSEMSATSVTEIPWGMANWLLGKRFAPELAITIVRDTTFAQTTTTQSFTTSEAACSCDSLTSSPKTLESIWCEQEDGPVSSPLGTQSQRSPFRMSPDLFVKVYLRARGS